MPRGTEIRLTAEEKRGRVVLTVQDPEEGDQSWELTAREAKDLADEIYRAWRRTGDRR